MKAKKSQITMFIIVGAVLTIMFLFLFTMSVQKPEISEELFEAELNFQTMADNLHDYRQECIERAVKDTITDYGLYPSDETKAVLESVISERVWYCIDPSVYTDQFYSLEESYPQTNVTVYSRSVIVNVLYAATLISPEGDLQKEYKEELFVFQRTASVELDEVAIVFLVSTDDRFEIRISKGSEFRDEDGQLLDELSVFILDDQDLLGFDHPNILGNVYLVTGSTVKPKKVKVSIRYEDYNILDGFREEDLTLAWYDEVREVWVAVASSVDPDNNIVSGSMNSFSAIALVSGANTNNKNEKWNANWYKWPFPSYFVEHIHRPCRPYYEVTDDGLDYVFLGGRPKPLVPESILRYSGVYDKSDTTYWGQEDPNELRWYLNNYCPGDPDYEEPTYSLQTGEKEAKQPESCGAVYLPPQVMTELARFAPGASEDLPAKREFQFRSGISPAEIINDQGESLASFIGGDGLYAQYNQVFKDIEFDPQTAHVTVGDKTDSELDLHDWHLVLEPGVNPLLEPSYWQEVSTGRPNEFAEQQIGDWDDDDQEELIEKNCYDPDVGEVSCLKCAGAYCERYGAAPVGGKTHKGLTKQGLAQECYNKCKESAEDVYNSYFGGFSEWNPSNDGILDFKWEGGLVRNSLNCNINIKTQPIWGVVDLDGNKEIVGYDYIVQNDVSCNVEPDDLATPMYMSYVEYKDGPERGYEGAGDNYYPVTNTVNLQPGYALLASKAQVGISCSVWDECYVKVNGVEMPVCIPGLPDPENNTNPFLLTGGCSYEFDSSILHADNNTITAWVVNKLDSHDVCAYVNVGISLGDGIGITPTNCIDNPEECVTPYCPPEDETCLCDFPPCEEIPPDDDGECPPDINKKQDKCWGNRGLGQEKQCDKVRIANPDGWEDDPRCIRADYEDNNRGRGQRTDEGTREDVNNPSGIDKPKGNSQTPPPADTECPGTSCNAGKDKKEKNKQDKECHGKDCPCPGTGCG